MDKHLLQAWSDAQYAYSISSTNVLFITIKLLFIKTTTAWTSTYHMHGVMLRMHTLSALQMFFLLLYVNTIVAKLLLHACSAITVRKFYHCMDILNVHAYSINYCK